MVLLLLLVGGVIHVEAISLIYLLGSPSDAIGMRELGLFPTILLIRSLQDQALSIWRRRLRLIQRCNHIFICLTSPMHVAAISKEELKGERLLRPSNSKTAGSLPCLKPWTQPLP